MKVGTTAELHNDTGSQGETDTKGNWSQAQMSTMAKCPKGHTRKGTRARGHKGKRRMDKGIQGQRGIRVTRYKGHKGNGIKGHNRVNGCKVKYAYG